MECHFKECAHSVLVFPNESLCDVVEAGCFNVEIATNYNNGTRSGPEKPSRNPGLRSESAGAGNGQELTPPIWQAL
ncbi:hypothetical protein J6590_089067 [Homalodisca vitripennis]|nr:hypothetical protein J6590_089067 [Homalodisca vitripennis]